MTACHPVRGRSLLRRGVVSLACGAACGSAAAQAGDALRFTFHSTLSAGVGIRTSKPRCDFIGQDNGGCASTAAVEMAARYPTQFSQSYDALRINQDDGNLNYRRGRAFSETLHGLHELFVEGQEGWSGLLRGTWTYDAAADRTARTPLERDARRQATHDARFLDAYVTKDFEIGGRGARVRVGNQVLNWGDSTFIAGGINSINAIDVTKTHAPGAQIKEIALPAPMAVLNIKLSRGVGLETYVQWHWNAMRLDPVGSFFSTSDVAGRGSTGIYLPTSVANQVFSAIGMPAVPAGSTGDPGTLIGGVRRFSPAELADAGTSPLFGALGTGSVVARGADVNASNRGQFGAALRWTLPDSGDELGFYAFRYHDKVPSFDIRVNQVQASNPFAWDAIYGRYVERKTLVGVSYGTRLADWTLGTELSYRPRETVLIDPTVVIDAGNPYYCNGDLNPANYRPTGYVCGGSIQTRKLQAHLTATNLLAPNGSLGGMLRLLGASEGSFITELAVAHYPSLKFDAGVPYAVTNDERQPTRTAAGFVAQLSVSYPAAFGTRATLSPDITYSRGVYGIAASSLPGFVKGAGALTAGLTTDFKTHPALRFRVDYTRNHGGGLSNSLRDRNFASASLTTEF